MEKLRSNSQRKQRKIMESLNLSKKKKSIPYYLKNDLPDHRFLEFRLFIHNRKVNEVQHELKFFDSMINSLQAKRKTRSFSAYRRNEAYKKVKKRYMNNFTSGQIDFFPQENENVDAPQSRYRNLSQQQAVRFNSLVERAAHKKKFSMDSQIRSSSFV